MLSENFSPPVIDKIPDQQVEPENINSYGWNNRLESSAKEIGEMSSTYKLMHLAAARKKERTGKIYSNIAICLGPFVSVIEAIEIVLYPPENHVLPILAIVIGFISMFIASKLKLGNFEGVTKAHQETSTRYTSLESSVRRQLSLYRSDRVSAKEYMTFISSSFQDLLLAAPIVPSRIFKKYKRMAKVSGLATPIFYSNTINIDLDYQKEKIEDIKNSDAIIVNELSPSAEDSDPDVENQLKKIGSKTSLKGVTNVKRTSVLSPYPDLEKYGDNMLRYEMSRFKKNL